MACIRLLVSRLCSLLSTLSALAASQYMAFLPRGLVYLEELHYSILRLLSIAALLKAVGAAGVLMQRERNG